MSHNPYHSPQAPYRPQPAPGHQEVVTSRMLSVCAESRTWTLLLAILMLLFVGLWFLAFAYVLLHSQQGEMELPPAALAGNLAFVLLFQALPGVLLFLVSQRLAAFVATGRVHELLAAVRSQRTFWIVLGVLGLLQGIGMGVTVAYWFAHAQADIEWLRSLVP